MPIANPFGWGRRPRPQPAPEKPAVSPESICATLNHIFVSQMGIANGISLENDPKTGARRYHIRVPATSSMPQAFHHQEIAGIPVCFSIQE